MFFSVNALINELTAIKISAENRVTNYHEEVENVENLVKNAQFVELGRHEKLMRHKLKFAESQTLYKKMKSLQKQDEKIYLISIAEMTLSKMAISWLEAFKMKSIIDVKSEIRFILPFWTDYVLHCNKQFPINVNLYNCIIFALRHGYMIKGDYLLHYKPEILY